MEDRSVAEHSLSEEKYEGGEREWIVLVGQAAKKEEQIHTVSIGKQDPGLIAQLVGSDGQRYTIFNTNLLHFVQFYGLVAKRS